MNHKKFFSLFLTLLLALSLIPSQKTVANAFSLTAKPECGFIMLNWDRAPDAVRYYVYRGPGEGLEYSMPLTDFAITDTSYKDTNDLVVNQKYCYFIKAVGKDDKEFLKSTEACATMTCASENPEPPEISEEDCKLILKFQVDNKTYWKNEVPKTMDTPAKLIEQRMLLVLRPVAEETNAKLTWDGTTRTVTIQTLDGIEIKLQVGNPIASVNGINEQIDPNNKKVVPLNIDGRIHLPLRYCATKLGAKTPDIIWHAETKIAELIFKDPNCKWVCGCIRKLPPSSLTNNIPQYAFFENCNKEKPLAIKIPMDMKDNILKLSFLEYIKKYPNQDYWCVELRIDENGNVVRWRARPEQYPNCCKPNLPVDCKPICGCVRKWEVGANGILNIFFAPECKEGGNYVQFSVAPTLKDTALGFTFIEYFRKYANQKYWCIIACIDGNRNLISWEATPQKYPNCCEEQPLECKWVEGSIIKANQTPGTNFWTILFAPECKMQNTIELQIPGTLLDLSLSISLAEYIRKFSNQKYWCLSVCIDGNGKIVNWKATPEKYPDCCPQPAECRWICGCILKAGPNAASNMWTIIFDPGCKGQNPVDLQIPPDLLDQNLGITIRDYINKYPDVKFWCVSLCLDADQKIVNWKATPEKYPNCCDEKPTKVLCACIVRMTIDPDSAGFYQVYIKVNCTGSDTEPYDMVLNFPSNMMDEVLNLSVLEYYNSIPGEPPKNACIEVEIDTTDNSVINWWAYPDRTPCCEVTNKGRILAYIPTECIEGTTFVITDLQGKTVWKGHATNEGILDTQCVLLCPERYIVTPYNEKCTFDPKSQEVRVPCCPDKAEVKFTCNCGEEPKGGRIKIHMSKECADGTTIYIYDAETGELVRKVTREDWVDSFFDVMCKLPCPKKYKIVPRNEKCNFNPPSQIIEVPCCPESVDVKFGCECDQEPQQGGRIKISMPEECLKGTVVFVYEVANGAPGKVIWKGEANREGYFDTGCILPCPSNVIVIPKNETCKFIKESIEVEVPCCPKSVDVSFECDCTKPKGRIKGTVGRECAGAEISIVKVSNLRERTIFLKTDAMGGFDSECALECGATYVVTPSKASCTFIPSSMKVTINSCCPDGYEKAEFKCDCKPIERKARIAGNILGNCNPGTMVTIYDENGASVWYGQVNANGYFETSSADAECILICPGTYNIVPVKKGCTFYPPNMEVIFNEKECCDNNITRNVNFKCNCEKNPLNEKPVEKIIYTDKLSYLTNDPEVLKII